MVYYIFTKGIKIGEIEMLKKELLERLKEYDDYDMIIISDGKGWSNIDTVEKIGCNINLILEKYPLFW